VSSSAPTVSGSPQQGQTATEGHGAWSHAPSSYAYQWEDCSSDGTGCSAIAGATGQTYTLSAADVGHAIRVQETAGNAGGNGAAATSGATTVVLPLAPSDLSAPTIGGTNTAGQTLTEAHGAWANNPTGYSYQWEDCSGSGGGCAAIAGATGQAYTLRSSDVDHTIRVLEGAANPGGAAAAATSSVTAVVQPSAATVNRSLSAVLTPSGANKKLAHLVSGGGYKLLFGAPSGGILQISWYAGKVLVAAGHATASSAGSYPLKLALTPKGKSLLKRSRRVQIASTATFTPTGGGPITTRRTFTLKR
jgi:hypothetical protein